jgi:hypothetical protein
MVLSDFRPQAVLVEVARRYRAARSAGAAILGT